METVTTRLQETGHQIVKQGDAFVARTRDAGVTFLDETREAGTQLIGAVRIEAKRWRRFATQRATALQSGLRNGMSRARLAELERKPNGKNVKKVTNGKATARSRKVKSALPPMAA